MNDNPIGSNWEDVRKTLFTDEEIEKCNDKVEKIKSGCSVVEEDVSTTIFDVAKYILHKCGSLSTMKLQKLCYYSQAWSMVWDDIALFNEDFEAWANGPVCRNLYDLHSRRYRINESFIGGNGCIDNLSESQKETIDLVLNHYAKRDAQYLSTLTHMEDPWRIARGSTPLGDHCETIITKASMAEYYGGI